MSQAARSLPAPHRFTREEYHRMGQAGLFADERVELLDGEIITMSPQDSPHAGSVNRVLRAFMRVLDPPYLVRPQLPIVLNNLSEPEPDIAVCKPDPSDYTREHPTVQDVLVLVEVAQSSLAYDRGRKGSAYARAGIPTYAIVNLPERVVEVLTGPDQSAARYRRTDVLRDGDSLPLPGGAVVVVSDLLPPR